MKKLCLPCSLSPPLPPMERDRGPLPPFPPQLLPHRPVLFSATVATDTPAETINKLTALIPAGRRNTTKCTLRWCRLAREPTDNSRGISTLSSVSNKKAAAYRGSFYVLFTAEQLKISYALSGR